jgi:hypothetical protein
MIMTTTIRTYRLNIATPDGQPLFTVLLSRERPEHVKPAPTSAPTSPTPSPTPPSVSGGNGDPKMTEPQKRYLFRLLAQQGLDGKAAEAHLKQVLQVITLREVSKTTASQLIERLIAEQKEAGHAHA